MQAFEWVVVGIILFLNFLAAGHALLYKRDPKGAWAWIVTCLLVPTLGPILYFLLGINRVKTRAKKLKWYWPHWDTDFSASTQKSAAAEKKVHDFEIAADFHQLAQLSEAISKRPLLQGNQVTPLYNGEQAYPEMLAAIKRAEKSIYLVTFIFESNDTGRQFANALSKAVQRGVDVRVLVDGIGEYYSWPRIGRTLKDKGVPFVRFLPPKIYPPSPFINLRYHRKMLIVDSEFGFTGGMNLGDRHLVTMTSNRKRKQDVHFKFSGAVVNQMEEVFMEDWGFCTGDYSKRPRQKVVRAHQGEAVCRTITVGPNQDLDKLRILLTGIVSQARKRILIMTPYFLPSQELIVALQTAALKGLEVSVVLPEKNNLPYVHWATRNMLWEILQSGVRVFYQPPPFAHSKLFVADDSYALIGSANMDPRSLRLNFELVVEVYERRLAGKLARHIRSKIRESHETTLQEVDSRSLPVRTRDSFCWLFSPYL
ncbi:cardiolipin synthase [Desulfonatronospira sp.]|uniref:cardiolipin synthase n=1 Tax=Desulfonatronospira sp. TaxID=1962951 RepID=UPI0025BE27BD|nr:cardiolipin synthase [Desulfonatronospira sp.]